MKENYRTAMKRSLPFAASLLLLLAVGVERANACSCAGTPSPSEAYTDATAVFVGSVTKVSPGQPQKNDDGVEYYGEQRAEVRVEEAFKGVKAGAQIVLRQPGHNCAPKYAVGARVLMYAAYHKKERAWEVYGCGRGGSIDRVADDLLYLRALPASAERTRLSGELVHYEDDPEKGFSVAGVLAGVRVTISGMGKTYEVSTDANGVYELYDATPGKYAIEPDIPPGLKIRFSQPFGSSEPSEGKTIIVGVQAKSCAGSDFIFSSDTKIGGKVYGANGELLSGVCVNILPAEKAADRYFQKFDCTEQDGAFTIDEIAPGKYLIVVNDDGEISADEPFPTIYYPGVTDRTKAKIITVGAGSRSDNYDIRIESQLPTRVIEGELFYADGKPVAGETVKFTAVTAREGYERDARGVTDEAGRFSLRVLAGTAGALQGEISTYESEHVNCPQIEKLIRANKSGSTLTTIETKPFDLEVKDDVQGVVLFFPFPSCQKRKQDD